MAYGPSVGAPNVKEWKNENFHSLARPDSVWYFTT